MKHFSLEEAEHALAGIEKILAAALEMKERAEEKMRALAKAERDPHAKADKLALERAQVEFLAQNIQSLLQQIQDQGVLVKGLDPALVDFPHLMGDREVFLCWMYGEKRIEHYHSIEEGFAGRKPLPPKVAAPVGRREIP